MFILYNENMVKLEFPDGVKPLDIFISSIGKERVTEKVESAHGKIDYGFNYSEREIDLNFYLVAKDTQDYRLLRDELYAMIDKIAYISELYQPGKKYNVVVDEDFIPERLEGNQKVANAEVKCFMPGLPFAESVITSQDIEKNGLRYSDELWSYGMGLSYDETTHKYTHEVSGSETFKIYNPSDVPINPFEQKLRITMSDVIGAEENLKLRNKTNGTTITIKPKIKFTDVVVYDNANVTRNGLQFLRETEKDFIELDVGWNEFEIKECSKANIAFDFRFYYF